MAVPRTVSLTAYNRPHYLVQVLDALKISIKESSNPYEVFVYCDRSSETETCLELARTRGFSAFSPPERVGGNAAAGEAISWGFDEIGSGYHIHIEDDIVLSKDAILWFEWAERLEKDPNVFTISGYSKTPSGRIDEYALQSWFHGWGFSTWKNRWEEFRWSKKHPFPTKNGAGKHVDADGYIQHVRGNRVEAYPCISRAQNIGAIGGWHVRSAKWHKKHQLAEETSGDARVSEFYMRGAT